MYMFFSKIFENYNKQTNKRTDMCTQLCNILAQISFPQEEDVCKKAAGCAKIIFSGLTTLTTFISSRRGFCWGHVSGGARLLPTLTPNFMGQELEETTLLLFVERTYALESVRVLNPGLAIS